MESPYATLIAQMARTLAGMDRWIDKAEAHAQARKFEADLLLQSRLAPDMLPLGVQIGVACDLIKMCAARLSGRTAPVHADNQKTWGEIRVRIREVSEFLNGFGPADFPNAPSVKAVFPWNPGQALIGDDYFVKFTIPNFHFHVVTAYAILRHNGVDLGKADFIGELPFQPA